MSSKITNLTPRLFSSQSRLCVAKKLSAKVNCYTYIGEKSQINSW